MPLLQPGCIVAGKKQAGRCFFTETGLIGKERTYMNYQWYPGHMTKAKRMMQEDMKLIDLVIELTDARAPLSSKNPDIDSLSNGKSRIMLLNKSDLSDPAANDRWKAYFEEQGYFTAMVNSQRGNGLRQIQPLIEKACAEKIERDRKRGILGRPVRAMICGIPNVGKSTFINSFSGKASTKTGNKPGVTRGKQWIRVNKQLEFLDTPGILWPKFEDQPVGIRLALIGSIKDELLNAGELCAYLILFLERQYPGLLKDRYQLDDQAGAAQADGESDELFAARFLGGIAAVRGCLKREKEPDLDRAAALVLDDFRKAKLGKISLEIPEATL